MRCAIRKLPFLCTEINVPTQAGKYQERLFISGDDFLKRKKKKKLMGNN